MKKNILNPDDIDYTDCLLEELRSFPFSLGLKKGCGFLLAAFNALQAQQEEECHSEMPWALARSLR
jgi:hypothetical protein